MQGNVNASKDAEKKTVVQQSVVALDDHRKGQTAKAQTSQTNAGAVARGDKLAKLRPDLAAAS